MKKQLYFLLSILISHPALSINRTWVGTTDNWATATNWVPRGVPGTSDILTIENTSNNPVIYAGTSAQARRIFMESGTMLTISQTASLSLTNASPNEDFPAGINMTQATLINNGTLAIQRPSSSVVSLGIGAGGESIVTNSGTMNIQAWTFAIQLSETSALTNTLTGVINAKGNNGVNSLPGGSTTITNNGVMNLTGDNGGHAVVIDDGHLVNYGTINILAGVGMFTNTKSTIENYACGKIIFENVDNMIFENGGTVSNMGLMQIDRRLKNQGTITNSGVLKYVVQETAGGTLSNSGIVINDKTTPVASVSASSSLAISGIYKDKAGSVSAGTFTQPDQFSPSGLQPGDITLYAKITPSGGGCDYSVPFVYAAPPLPVTLAGFSGKNTGDNQIKLTWFTLDEKNFAYFEIQRSSDARAFEAIGLIDGSQQTSALKHYEYIDNHILGISYYRLKMVDRDGSYQFSTIISVLNTVENCVVGNFYPNPSSGQVFVDVYAEASETWRIRVFDTSGKTIAAHSRILQKGMNKIPLTNLIKGLNIVQFENSKLSVSRKLVWQ